MRPVCLTILLAAIALPAGAQLPKPIPRPAGDKTAAPPLPQAPATTAQLTYADIEAFLDGLLPLQLQENDIAGAVVSVVKDGKVLFAKGYGYADVKQRKPVTVDSTLFRIGSISKTFTWTAVMQLVEQGKIDIDRDVNEYIDFKIPPAFGKPVTMRNLLTHTAGFEEGLKEIFLTKSAELRPLKEWLPTHIPQRIFPPGTTPAYSNYGATLAGYIVERLSGMPFNDYIDTHIVRPLGMANTTFAQPLPSSMQGLMSQGYQRASKPAKDYETVQVWPAGSTAASAGSMSRFMIAHLEDGAFNGAQILKPESVRLTHSRLFETLPTLNAMAYGFYEESRNGHHIVGHGGDTQWFHSDMHLMIEDHIGFFVSYNSAGKGGSPRTALWERFLDRYFPFTPAHAQTLATAARDAESVAGVYRSSRREQTTVASTIWMLSYLTVTKNADSTISNGENDFAGNPKHFEEIAPLLFREVHGQGLVGFKTDSAGRRIMSTDGPIAVYEPVPALKSSRLNLTIVVFALCMLALSLLAWPVNALLRKHYAYAASLTSEYRRLRTLVRLACIVNVMFIVFWIWFFSAVQADIGMFSARMDARIHLAQVIGILGALSSLLALYYCQRSWADRSLWLWTKVWNTLLAVAFVGYAGFLLNWHLLSFNLRY